MIDEADFVGAKLALVHEGQVLCYLRDIRDDIPFPGQWDLPGGGREGDETPEACALRELDEEFALRLPETRLIWRRTYNSVHRPGGRAWFFAGNLHQEEIAAIRFGSEGQFWRMRPLTEFIGDGNAVPYLRDRLRDLNWH